MNAEQALEIVYRAIDVVNGQRTADQQIGKSPDMTLVGEGGVLDSLGLVTLILAIERDVRQRHNIEIDIVGDEAFSEEASQLQTPVSIANLLLEYIA